MTWAGLRERLLSLVSRRAGARQLGHGYERGLVCAQWTMRFKEMGSQRFQNRCTRFCFGKRGLAACTGW